MEDPWDAYERGRKLAGRGGRSSRAEAAYRQAIDGGVDAWLHLGALLATCHGRETEEEVAYRRAMASEHLPTATAAALRLGALLDRARDDQDGARSAYEFAEREGDEETSFLATAQLAVLLAEARDAENAQDRARSFAIWYATRRGLDFTDGTADSIANVMSAVAGGRWTGPLFRRFRITVYAAGRRYDALVALSATATGIRHRLRDTRQALGARFWKL